MIHGRAHLENTFEYGVAQRTIPGEQVSGDQFLVHFRPEGALFAVIDGAGHGVEAVTAASVALSVLTAAHQSAPGQLLSLCHEAMRSTRGAAISLASIEFSNRLLNWAGVGNVEAVVLQKSWDSNFKRESLLLRNGVVGYNFSQPRVSTLPLNLGDILILATDGIGPYFLEGISLEESCQDIANSIMNRHAKGTDDALALVVRLVEGHA